MRARARRGCSCRVASAALARRDRAKAPRPTPSPARGPSRLAREAERAAGPPSRGRMRGARPADGVVGEEGGNAGGSSGVRWVVAPVDGPANCLFGTPQWAVAVAAEDADGALV